MTVTPTFTDDELLTAFCNASLPSDAFHHEQHVRVAWLFVTRVGMPEALREFAVALRRFADAKGATSLYHTTITWAYLLLINERQTQDPAGSWDAFATANPDLLRWKPSVLDQLYAPGTLTTDLARQVFVMPNATKPGAHFDRRRASTVYSPQSTVFGRRP
jgi:hypothetical protein